MTAALDILHPDKPKTVLIVASNPAVSATTGWPIGFWWSELTHPYWEFTEHGYTVDIASPDGGAMTTPDLGMVVPPPDAAMVSPDHHARSAGRAGPWPAK